MSLLWPTPATQYSQYFYLTVLNMPQYCDDGQSKSTKLLLALQTGSSGLNFQADWTF